MTIKTLYHGSSFYHKKLEPGFNRSGEEVEWDTTESNRFLYASTDKEMCLLMGFASYLENVFKLNSFKTDNKTITASFDEVPIEEPEVVIYIYQIDYRNSDNWVKVNNKHNNLDTEYKTKNKIKYMSVTPTLLNRKKLQAMGYKVTYVKS